MGKRTKRRGLGRRRGSSCSESFISFSFVARPAAIWRSASWVLEATAATGVVVAAIVGCVLSGGGEEKELRRGKEGRGEKRIGGEIKA